MQNVSPASQDNTTITTIEAHMTFSLDVSPFVTDDTPANAKITAKNPTSKVSMKMIINAAMVNPLAVPNCIVDPTQIRYLPMMYFKVC